MFIKVRKEQFEASTTLSNFGKPEYCVCYETEPVNGICRAGSLGCGLKSSWDNYLQCARKLEKNV